MHKDTVKILMMSDAPSKPAAYQVLMVYTLLALTKAIGVTTGTERAALACSYATVYHTLADLQHEAAKGHWWRL